MTRTFIQVHLTSIVRSIFEKASSVLCGIVFGLKSVTTGSGTASRASGLYLVILGEGASSSLNVYLIVVVPAGKVGISHTNTVLFIATQSDCGIKVT